MRLIAIDPGPVESAYVLFHDREIVAKDKAPSSDLLMLLRMMMPDGGRLAIEMIASYGMPVGREVFETCVWIGRFIEAWGGEHALVYRRDVKLHLCNSSRAKDANVRQALLDRYPAIGGGKTPQVGTKGKPGPLFGFSGDMWAALAVAVTYHEQAA